MENEVEYLYHYTTVEKLALILKNRTVRLSPLDKMDDLQEQKTADLENIGKFIFVSSWTDDATESIPMWKMYTDMVSGVRIKLRKNPFAWHETTMRDMCKATNSLPGEGQSLDDKIPTFLDYADMLNQGYLTPSAMRGDILIQVEYTDDIERLEPHVMNSNNITTNINLQYLGRCKSTYWSFQNEWRYLMLFMEADFKHGVNQSIASFNYNANMMAQDRKAPPFRYYDLEIDERYFKEMEIVCSPKIAAGNRIIVESLVEKYNPYARIIDSDLLGKL